MDREIRDDKAIISSDGLSSRFVHYDYCNHLGQSRASWETIMTDVARGDVKRFGLDVSKVFDDQLTKAQDNWVKYHRNAMKQYKNPWWTNRAGYVDWVKLTDDGRKDIEIVKDLVVN